MVWSQTNRPIYFIEDKFCSSGSLRWVPKCGCGDANTVNTFLRQKYSLKKMYLGDH